MLLPKMDAGLQPIADSGPDFRGGIVFERAVNIQQEAIELERPKMLNL